jgi:hypothetical protein
LLPPKVPRSSLRGVTAQSTANAGWRFLRAYELELIAGAISQSNIRRWEQTYALARNDPHQAARQATEELQHYQNLFRMYNVFGLPCSPDAAQLLKSRDEFIRIASQLRDCGWVSFPLMR